MVGCSRSVIEALDCHLLSEIAWWLLTLAVMMVTFITAKGSNDQREDVMLHA